MIISIIIDHQQTEKKQPNLDSGCHSKSIIIIIVIVSSSLFFLGKIPTRKKLFQKTKKTRDKNHTKWQSIIRFWPHNVLEKSEKNSIWFCGGNKISQLFQNKPVKWKKYLTSFIVGNEMNDSQYRPEVSILDVWRTSYT